MITHPNQLLYESLKNAGKNGPKLKTPKSPVIAFIMGFMFGPVGVGLYLGSFYDVAVPMGILVVVTLCSGGIAAPIGWTFSGLWGAIRAHATKQQPLPAVVVVPPPEQPLTPAQPESIDAQFTVIHEAPPAQLNRRHP
jgi:hypothetical protein